MSTSRLVTLTSALLTLSLQGPGRPPAPSQTPSHSAVSSAGPHGRTANFCNPPGKWATALVPTLQTSRPRHRGAEPLARGHPAGRQRHRDSRPSAPAGVHPSPHPLLQTASRSQGLCSCCLCPHRPDGGLQEAEPIPAQRRPRSPPGPLLCPHGTGSIPQGSSAHSACRLCALLLGQFHKVGTPLSRRPSPRPEKLPARLTWKGRCWLLVSRATEPVRVSGRD